MKAQGKLLRQAEGSSEDPEQVAQSSFDQGLLFVIPSCFIGGTGL